MRAPKTLRAVSLLASVCRAIVYDAAPLTVSTSSGQVTGFINDAAPHVRQFLSIPYAFPPIGPLRFQPPIAMIRGPPIQATALPSNCIQVKAPPGRPPGPPAGEGFTIAGDISEDCLYLNVYSPKKNKRDLPVLIWVYGGAFVSGGSDVPCQIPDQWVERTRSHVVVTFNYRLNIMGFPNAKAQPLNVGLMDQRLAGDPTRMVLWGQSAGGSSVSQYGYAYYDDPIVHGAIADSGGPTMLLTTDPTHSMFTVVAQRVGCGNPIPQLELACMQLVPAVLLQNALVQTLFLFFPYTDNQTAFLDLEERAAQGRLADYPMIFGTNADEHTAFAGLDPVTRPAVEEIRNRAKHGYKTYRYYYSGNFSNITPDPYYGATHSAELPLVFGTHEKYNNKSTRFERKVSYTMQDLWLSFAKHPFQSSSTRRKHWPTYNPETKSIVEFARGHKVSRLINSSIDQET